MPEAIGQEILYVRNSHVRLLTLLHDILLAQYQISVPPQNRTPHRLMMWSCASLLLDILSAPSRKGKHRESSNQRTFSSLPLTGTDKMETAEQHYGLAAILPASPRHDMELAEKRELWAAIFSDWIQGGSVVATVVEEVNPTLRLHLALLGLEFLSWIDEDCEEESAGLTELRNGHDMPHCNLHYPWKFSPGEGINHGPPGKRLRPQSTGNVGKYPEGMQRRNDCLYTFLGYDLRNQQRPTRHYSLVASNLLPVLL